MKIDGSTTAGSSEETLLGIYLNDHLATFVIGVELARRAARGREGSAAADTLERLATELGEDRSALLGVMKSLGVPVRQYKVVAARMAELVGRLKPNGHVLHRSPLSNVVEAEGLRVAVSANIACWRTLRELAETEPRLDEGLLERLLERAERQSDAVEDCRADAAAEAFGPASSGDASTAEAQDASAPPENAPPENVLPETAAEELPEPPAHDDLPLPDYDHLPKGSLPARIKSLDRAGVEKLLSYEISHANRLPVVLILERRLEALADGAEPTGGSVTALRPEAAQPR